MLFSARLQNMQAAKKSDKRERKVLPEFVLFAVRFWPEMNRSNRLCIRVKMIDYAIYTAVRIVIPAVKTVFSANALFAIRLFQMKLI